MEKVKIAYLAVSQSAYRVPLYELFSEDTDYDFKVYFDMDKTIGNPDWQLHENAKFNHELVRSIALWFPTKKHGKWERAFFVISSPVLLFKLLSDRPDVIITVEHSIRTLYAVAIKVLTGCKVIVTFDGTVHTEKFISKPKLLFRKILIKFIDAYCVLSDSGRKYLKEMLNVDAKKIFKTPFVCDIKKFKNIDEQKKRILKKRYELENKLVFISVGQLIPKKNIQGLLDAWCSMPKEFHKDSILLVVGDGPERKTVLNKAKSFNNIRFLGRVKYEEMQDVMNVSDVFLHVSFEDQWGLVVNEAMAGGLPVIVSKYAGAAELVQDGLNGFIIDPRRNKELENKLAWCMVNKHKLKKMGVESIEVIQLYTYEEAIRSFKQAIEYVRR